jgi:hypothetical protein
MERGWLQLKLFGAGKTCHISPTLQVPEFKAEVNIPAERVWRVRVELLQFIVQKSVEYQDTPGIV